MQCHIAWVHSFAIDIAQVCGAYFYDSLDFVCELSE